MVNTYGRNTKEIILISFMQLLPSFAIIFAFVVKPDWVAFSVFYLPSIVAIATAVLIVRMIQSNLGVKVLIFIGSFVASVFVWYIIQVFALFAGCCVMLPSSANV